MALMHLKRWRMVLGLIQIAEGLAVILTLGYYEPDWVIRFLVWHMELNAKARKQ